MDLGADSAVVNQRKANGLLLPEEQSDFRAAGAQRRAHSAVATKRWIPAKTRPRARRRGAKLTSTGANRLHMLERATARDR
jgi:hypothetical protein